MHIKGFYYRIKNVVNHHHRHRHRHHHHHQGNNPSAVTRRDDEYYYPFLVSQSAMLSAISEEKFKQFQNFKYIRF